MFTLLNLALMNLLLSSDNVLVIAVFGHNLSRNKRTFVLFLSMLVSLALQLGILFVVAFLFRITVLQSLFGIIICYMAFHLLYKHEPQETKILESKNFLMSVGKIALGNLMMSFENETTLISMSRGDVWLAWFGMLITAPLIFFGSNLIAWVLQKYAFLLNIGAIILVKIGLNLVFQFPTLQPYGPTGPWILTGLFAIYATVLFLHDKDIQLLRRRLR